MMHTTEKGKLMRKQMSPTMEMAMKGKKKKVAKKKPAKRRM